jgi:hypothetical protein
VVAEDFIVYHAHYIVLVVGVSVIQQLENFKLNSGLVLKLLFISDHFDCNKLLQLMIKTFDSLAKTARTQSVHHLVPIAQMIIHHDQVVATLIILTTASTLILLTQLAAKEINCLIL